MQNLIIEASNTSPHIIFDKQNNKFKIEGKSVVEESNQFFEPVIKWLENYCLSPNLVTHFEFNMDYFNISSSKNILAILYKLNDLKKSGNEVKITWYYGDDEMYEFGEDFAFLVKIPFHFMEDSNKKNTVSVFANNDYKSK